MKWIFLIFCVIAASAEEGAKQIAIVDFGSQTAHLIARRIRQLGIPAPILQPDTALEQIAANPQIAGIILSGGPASVYEKDAPSLDRDIFFQDVPVLGICYGWQLMAQLLGGKVERVQKDYGIEEVEFSEDAFRLPEKKFRVVVSHGDCVTALPRGFRAIASTARVMSAAALHPEKRWVGLQFHPEMDHTIHGLDILKYFAADLCHLPIQPCAPDPKTLIQKIEEKIDSRDEVICAVSGGVDSTIASFLIAKAIGKRMHAIYVDSGLMRKGTKERVREIFTQHVDADLQVIDANDRFLDALKGIEDPEEKRKIIGKIYVDIFQEEAAKYPRVKYLAQGTIYSDVIESKGTQHASKIKSHHNVGGLPESLRLQLLEPLRECYKDEVRELGRLAGLPKEFVQIHPFPGPGYAIRIRGEVTPKRLFQLQLADAIVLEEIGKADLYDEVFQCFAIMTGAYSTAVKGDGKAFEEVVAIRAYNSTDVMTANWAKLPYPVLEKISKRIVNEVPNISRVVYDITSKPPATMEWE